MGSTRAGSDVVIGLEGVFDGLQARRLAATLLRAEAGERFQIDLTHVREFHDFGVAVLADALARSRALVAVRGLRHHQFRMLRYFGIDTAQLERAVASEAAA